MNVVEARPRKLDIRELKRARVSTEGVSRIVSGSCNVVDPDGRLLVAYRDLTEEPCGYPKDLLAAVRDIHFETTARTEGLPTTSRVFGFQPRITIRRDFCTTARLARDAPASHAVLADWARRTSQLYQSIHPTLFETQRKAVYEGVAPRWRLEGSVFTSGIVNRNNALGYHRDAGNFPGVWSNMVVLSKDTAGGHLVVPELDIAFTFFPTMARWIGFDGAALIHGVSPISLRSKTAYRYSIVWYALRGMCDCLSPAEELQRIRAVRAARETKRAKVSV